MKLWQKDYLLNKEIEEFTVGDDFKLDQNLLKYDLKVNHAHALMLEKIGILSNDELKKIIAALDKITILSEKDEFHITKDQEDVHTAVEEFLTKELGTTGKKIHTGKSRNRFGPPFLHLEAAYLVQRVSTSGGGLPTDHTRRMIPVCRSRNRCKSR